MEFVINISLVGLITIILVVLKLAGIISWSWWWIFALLIAEAIILLLLILFVLILLIFMVPPMLKSWVDMWGG